MKWPPENPGRFMTYIVMLTDAPTYLIGRDQAPPILVTEQSPATTIPVRSTMASAQGVHTKVDYSTPR